MNKEKIIKKIQDYTLNNYNNGGDVVFETWNDQTIIEFYQNHNNNLKATKKALDSLFDTFKYNDHFQSFLK